jgi:hypothetical protein
MTHDSEPVGPNAPETCLFGERYGPRAVYPAGQAICSTFSSPAAGVRGEKLLNRRREPTSPDIHRRNTQGSPWEER